MAISFACQCGKPLQAPDNFAGRKMRCPACGTVLTIPGAAVPAAPATAAGPALNAPARTAVLPVPAAPLPPNKKIVAAAAMTDATEVMDVPAKARRAARPQDEIMDTVAVDDDEVVATEEADEEPQMLVRRRPKKRTSRRPANIWKDPALGQEITPWPTGGRERVGAISERERGGRGKWLLLFLILLIGGAAAALWTFGDDIKKTLDANVRDVHQQVMRQR